ncbi:hypothetical protein, partial [Oscillatoria sp. HE19RPO]|uniref:hypothetical protein n=1 Tax=Oscillatoria sp. HE19RPO TaxID=2954806 RepID=UPI0020C2F27A
MGETLDFKGIAGTGGDCRIEARPPQKFFFKLRKIFIRYSHELRILKISNGYKFFLRLSIAFLKPL